MPAVADVGGERIAARAAEKQFVPPARPHVASLPRMMPANRSADQANVH